MLSHSAHSVRVVDDRLAAVLRPALGLAAEERVQPGVGRREVLGRGVLDLLDPVADAEHQRHRLGLERGLAAEQVGDRAARLAVVGGDGVGVEPRERADGDRLTVEQLGVAPDLLEHLELAELHPAAARLVLGERRPFGHARTVLDVAAVHTYGTYLRTYRTYARIERPAVTSSPSVAVRSPRSAAGASPSPPPPPRRTRSTSFATAAGLALAATHLLRGLDYLVLLAFLAEHLRGLGRRPARQPGRQRAAARADRDEHERALQGRLRPRAAADRERPRAAVRRRRRLRGDRARQGDPVLRRRLRASCSPTR